MDWQLLLILVLVLAVGFAAGWLAKRHLDRREESRALNELVTYLHLKRTLAPITPQPSAAGPMEARHRSAVQDLRENLMETLAHLSPGSAATEVLMRMSAACNRYLRNVAADPGRYQFDLAELRRNLDEDLRILTDGRRDIQYLSPGEAPARKGVPPSGGKNGKSGTNGTGGKPGTRKKLGTPGTTQPDGTARTRQ